MISVSARIPESLQKELEEFMDDEKLDRSNAVRKLLHHGLEDWRKERALEKLEKGEITLSKAAEISGIDIWSFADLVKEEKLTWVKDNRVREDIEAV